MENDRKQYFKVVRRCAFAMVLGLVALLLWVSRTMIADQFAASYEVRIGLMIQDKSDQGRVKDAFDSAQASLPAGVSATLTFDPKMWGHPEVMVSAPSHGQAVAAAQPLGKAIAAAFDAGGGRQLSVSTARIAHAVSNAARDAVLTALTFGAPLLELLAIGLFVVTWRGGRTNGAITAPKGMGYAVALALGLPVAMFMIPGPLFMALFAMSIPTAIAGVIVYKMREVHRAARWPSAQGRIVRSKTRTVKTKVGDGPASRGNAPDIEYVFSVDGVEHRGKRIGIGEIKPDSPEVEAALDRYQVGRTGPVYYNPEDPNEAVLERDAPANPATMYTVAAGVMFVGLAVVIAFWWIGDIIAWLQPHFPPGAIIQGFLFFLGCGLVTSLSLISNLASARAAARWPTAVGTVLTSRAESRRELVSRGQGQTVVVWSPLVEYSYHVGTRDYHGARIAFGPAVSGPRELAEATVARYPAGTSVTVHYDPANPSQSTLETRIAFAWISLVVTAAFFAVALFFSGRFGG
jgi:hypothetical protein